MGWRFRGDAGHSNASVRDQSPYEVLGVATAANEVEIRAAYVAMARTHHPDSPGGSLDRMQQINDAWAVLSDAKLRRRLDAAIEAEQRSSSGHAGAETVEDDSLDLDYSDERAVDGAEAATGAPIVGTARAVIAFAPICFVAGIVVFVLGVVLQVAPVVQGGLMVLLVSLVAFLMAPFLAMGASIQRGSVAVPGEESAHEETQ